MKNKFISVLLSCFLFISSAVSSFANPVAGIYLSYEAMMGLLALAGACGIVINTSEDYWRFTKSLADNWQDLLDLTNSWEGEEPYLKNLEDMVWYEYINRPKPDEPNEPNEPNEPIKLPWIPGLEKIFSKIGEDISPSYKYMGNYLNDTLVIDNYNSSKLSSYDIKYIPVGEERPIAFVYEYIFDKTFGQYYISNSPLSNYTITGSPNYFPPGDWGFATSYGSLGDVSLLKDVSLGFFVNSDDDNKVYIAIKGINKNTSNVFNVATSLVGVVGSGEVKIKNPIEYTPTVPTVQGNSVLVPSVPSITIPNFEEMPGKVDGQKEPIVVGDPLEIPNTNPNPGPGGDTDSNPGPGTDIDNSSLTDYIVSLVVPSDTFWTDTFGGLRDNFEKAFPMLDMSSFESLVVGGKPFPNIDVDVMGVRGRVVDGDVINSIVDWLRPLIAGFIMLCLMFFNYRKIYKLIRNTEPFGNIAPGSSDFRTGMSAPGMSEPSNYEIARDQIRDLAFEMRNEILHRKHNGGV